jgi:predicted glycosyltransferase
MIKTPYTVMWFSAGVSSAVAWKLASDQIDEVCYIHIDDQEPDTIRFVQEVSKWVGLCFRHWLFGRLGDSEEVADLVDSLGKSYSGIPANDLDSVTELAAIVADRAACLAKIIKRSPSVFPSTLWARPVRRVEVIVADSPNSIDD